MAKLMDLTGQRFGALVALSRDERPSKGARWLCACDCGGTTIAFTYNLRSGHTKSCGCIRNEASANRTRTHGLSGTQEHKSWKSMIRRCTDINFPNYKRYGAKGITVCEAWRDFTVFLADMGPMPTPRHSIDRIDNSKGYSKENCKWSSDEEQMRNRTNSRMTLEKAVRVHVLRRQGLTRLAIAEAIDCPLHCVEDVLRGRTFKDSIPPQ